MSMNLLMLMVTYGVVICWGKDDCHDGEDLCPSLVKSGSRESPLNWGCKPVKMTKLRIGLGVEKGKLSPYL